jgi:2-oxoisovalerate dehydrogenase E1 component
MSDSSTADTKISLEAFKKEVLQDYAIAYQSRIASLTGRKEVLTGKAKFGIFGDGKEVAQLAMAKVFREGDFRSGYYRDQTFMFAKGINTIQEFFAQLYAHTDVKAEPNSAGRSMNGHFSSRMLDKNGEWLPQTSRFNVSADISPTGGQMPRLLGLALASKLYRDNPELHEFKDFSVNGNEIAFGTIGNASTSEGCFWEVMNAAGVLQVPMLLSIWDDEYGISVPAKYQTTKENLSALLLGFVTDENGKGIRLFTVKGWDYPELVKVYTEAAKICREEHTPVVVHVIELTQPQGHSTSGSHERYKSKERLEWEKDFDCINKMKTWVIQNGLASEDELSAIEEEADKIVKNSKNEAWKAYLSPIKEEIQQTVQLLNNLASKTKNSDTISDISNELSSHREPIRRNIGEALINALKFSIHEKSDEREQLVDFYNQFLQSNEERYSSRLYSQSLYKISNIPHVAAEYNEESVMMDGREIMQACFDANLNRDSRIFAFGEDVGKIGDVNQGFAGLQEKYGEIRVTDTGIRELSIVGQGIGAAMRGLRPIAEVQYLDYLLYAIQIMSDDLATLQYRSFGQQKSPLIIRTRGHRLEGIWHSGSPMGMIINALKGMYVCVPRNMTQAAGMYNLLLRSDEPALVIECLNGYRLKEKMPENIGEFTVPLGVPEILKEGKDLTLVTYGSCVRIAEEAIAQLEETGISVELIDVQTLIPFDINHIIVESVKKTNKLIVLDEDVRGGASAFILQHITEDQKAFRFLDSEPVTITSKDHRPAYGTDGDYFSKPSADDVYKNCYKIMNEYNPEIYPSLF